MLAAHCRVKMAACLVWCGNAPLTCCWPHAACSTGPALCSRCSTAVCGWAGEIYANVCTHSVRNMNSCHHASACRSHKWLRLFTQGQSHQHMHEETGIWQCHQESCQSVILLVLGSILTYQVVPGACVSLHMCHTCTKHACMHVLCLACSATSPPACLWLHLQGCVCGLWAAGPAHHSRHPPPQLPSVVRH